MVRRYRVGRWFLYSVWVLGVPVALLATVEGCLRWIGYGEALEPVVERGGWLYPNPRYFEQYSTLPLDSIMEWDLVEFAVSARKPPQTCRIVVYGESAAYGTPFHGYGFWHYLYVLLQEAFPSLTVEVLPFTVPGTNTNVLQGASRALPVLAPDVVVIYAGNNEGNAPGLTGALAAATYFIPNPVLFTWVEEVRSLRLMQWLRGGVREDARPLVLRTLSNLEDALGPYRQNVEQIMRNAGKAGAGVVLCTLARNVEGEGFMQGGTDSDGVPLERHPLNRTLLDVYAAWKGVPGLKLADVDRALWNRSIPPRPPDFSLFQDIVHLNTEGEFLVARAVCQAVGEVLAERYGVAEPSAWLSQEECEKRLALGPAHKFMLYDAFATAPNLQEREAMQRQAMRYRPAVKDDPVSQVCEEFEAALSVNPNDGVLNIMYAKYLTEKGLRERLGERVPHLEAQCPHRRAALRYRAIWLELTGRGEAALEVWREMLKRFPDDRRAREAVERLTAALRRG